MLSFIKSVLSGAWADYIPVLLFAPPVLLLSFKKYYDLRDERVRARIPRLREAVESEYVEGSAKEFLKEEIATEYFKVASGVRLEKRMRSNVLDAYRSLRGELAFDVFKKAVPFFDPAAEKLEVGFSFGDYFEAVFNLVYSFVLFVLAVLASTLVFLSVLRGDVLSISQAVLWAAMAAFSIFIGLMLVVRLGRFRAACLIKTKLKNSATGAGRDT